MTQQTTLETRVARLEGAYEHLATKADIANLRTELKGDIAELKTELKTDLVRVGAVVAVAIVGLNSLIMWVISANVSP